MTKDVCVVRTLREAKVCIEVLKLRREFVEGGYSISLLRPRTKRGEWVVYLHTGAFDMYRDCAGYLHIGESLLWIIWPKNGRRKSYHALYWYKEKQTWKPVTDKRKRKEVGYT